MMLTTYTKEQVLNLLSQKRLSGRQTEKERAGTREQLQYAIDLHPQRTTYQFQRTPTIGLVYLIHPMGYNVFHGENCNEDDHDFVYRGVTDNGIHILDCHNCLGSYPYSEHWAIGDLEYE